MSKKPAGSRGGRVGLLPLVPGLAALTRGVAASNRAGARAGGVTSRHESLEAHGAREEARAQSCHVLHRARLAPLERRYEARDELGA
eukprot:scaffold17116_cov67-Phaeocystis_antarctica.AAC.4